MEAMKLEAGGGGASSKDIEKLKAENNELKKINAKQRYHIKHLAHNFREKIEGKG
jgi:cell division protein FtsB